MAPQFQTNISPRTTSSGTSDSIGQPAGLADGDLLLLHVYIEPPENSATAPVDVSAAGFTPLGQFAQTSETAHVVLYRPVPDASVEPASYLVEWVDDVWHELSIQRVSGADLNDPIEGVVVSASETGNGPPGVDITTTGPDRLLCWSGTNFNNWETDDTWAAPTAGGNWVSADPQHIIGVAYRPQATAGTLADVTATSTNNGPSTGIGFAIKPAGAAGTAPTVDAGPDAQVNVGQEHIQNGTVTNDGGGTISGGGWEIVAGPSNVGDTVDTFGISFTPLQTGTWTFRFWAQNEFGTDEDFFDLTAVEDVPTVGHPAIVQDKPFDSGTLSSTTNVAVLDSAATVNNLLVITLAGDKNTGSLTVSDDISGTDGWTIEVSAPSSSVSLYIAWKTAAGGETTITCTTSNGPVSGNTAWAAELSQDGTDPWTVLDSALNATDEGTRSTVAIGPTGSVQVNGLSIAVGAMDSISSSGTTSWSDSYVSANVPPADGVGTSGGGSAGCWVATKQIDAGQSTSTTFNAGGSDQLSGALVVFGRKAPPTPPGSVFDLEDWKWQGPIEDPNDPGDLIEVQPADLDTYSSDYLYLDDQGRMVMDAPVDGFTTGTGTRSEFREMEGGVEAAWNLATSTIRRQLTVTGTFDATGISGGSNPRQEMIIGQIHGPSGTPPIYLAAEYHVATPRIRIYKDGPGLANVLEGITPTTEVTYRILVENGTVYLFFAFGGAENLPATPDFQWAAAEFTEDTTTCYLKAGAYNKTDAASGATGSVITKISYFELLQPGDPTSVTVDAPAVDVTVTPEVVTADHSVVARPEPVDATIEPAAVTTVIGKVIADLDAIDVNTEVAEASAAKVVHVDPVDATISSAEIEASQAADLRLFNLFVTPRPITFQTGTMAAPLDVTAEPADVSVAKVYDVGVVDIDLTPQQPMPAHVKHLDVVDTSVMDFQVVHIVGNVATPVDQVIETPTPKAGKIYDVAPVDITIDPTDVGYARAAAADAVDTSTELKTPLIYTFNSRPVETAVEPVDITTARQINPLVVGVQVEVTQGSAAHVVDVTPIDVTMAPPDAYAFTGDFDAIDINLELLPAEVAFSAESTPAKSGIGQVPKKQPTRVIAQSILTKEWLHWDLEVHNLTIEPTLSGATAISGDFPVEIKDYRDLGLEPWGTWIHIEEDGVIRASGILQPASIDTGEALSFEALGVTAYPHGIPYLGEYSKIGVDAAQVVRDLWEHMQQYPDAALGVEVTGATTVKLGTEIQKDENGNEIPDTGPYELMWWNATDCGQEINALAKETPFDFVERSEWNADKTDVLHFIDIGFPRIGRRRYDLVFREDENLLAAIGPEEDDTLFASQVLVIGAGEGRDTIKGYAGRVFGGRVRRVAIVDDKTIKTEQRAFALSNLELEKRQALFDVTEITINARHPNAPLGSFKEGDDVLIEAEVPWIGRVRQWERILSYVYSPDTEVVRLKLRRAESFIYGSGLSGFTGGGSG